MGPGVTMTKVNEKFGITQFKGQNFDTWKFRVEMVLDEHEVMECVREKPKENPSEDWMKKNRKCKSLITQCIADSHLEYVREKENAWEMWDNLKNVFQRKGVASQLYMRKKLLTIKHIENEPLETHFSKFDETIRQLKSAGGKMENADIVCQLLLSLPSSYGNVVTALETLTEEKLSVEFVKNRLLDEEAKREISNSVQEIVPEVSAFGSSKAKFVPKFKFKCYNCGKIGHKKSECWLLKNKGKEVNNVKVEREEETGTGVAFVTANHHVNQNGENSILWYVDSGATDHLINDERQFSKVIPLREPIHISVAKNGETLVATKVGSIDAISYVNGKNVECNIKNVLFVPELRCNLLSVKKLEQAGIKVVFDNGHVTLIRKNEVIAIGKGNTLYELLLQKVNAAVNICSGTESKEELWHRRFGHLGIGNLQKIVKSNMVLGIPEGCNFNDIDFCEACVNGKQSRLPFKNTRPKSYRPMELVHSDVCGPITPTHREGNRYFVTFIDDYTHFTVVYLMKEKKQVFELFKQYVAMATVHFGKSLSKLRCDNGGEFTSREIRDYCKEKGIQIQYTIPNTPEQNGVAERMNRTLVEKARTMVNAAEMEKTFWGEAILTAAYLTNRSPTSVLENKTPAEIWFNKIPDVGKLRIFGCKAYAHIEKGKRQKFDSKSKECIMMGYCTNGYRLWDIKNRKLFTARNVVFNENLFENKCEGEPERFQLTLKEDEEMIIHQPVENQVEDQTENLRRSERNKVQPSWYNDYNMAHLVLNAEQIFEEAPRSLEEAKSRSDYKQWKEAVENEMTSLRQNNTWTEVEYPKNQNVINCKWVFQLKRNGDGKIERYKARLVAKGFMQEKGVDYVETYAPVAKLTTVRTLLAIGIQFGFKFHQMDVKTAFLNGKLEEDIYMHKPEGFNTGDKKVCKLNKSLYGLKQSSRCWNDCFHKCMEKLNFRRSNGDGCLYANRTNDNQSYILLYVDDLIIAGNDEAIIKRIKEKLSLEFEMKDLGPLDYFLGLNIKLNLKNNELSISQKRNIEDVLRRFRMEECKESSTPIEVNLKLQKCLDVTKQTKKPYKELLGCLMYIMVGTRPDICYAVSYFSRYQDCASDMHWNHLLRIVRYLKGTKEQKLIFKKGENPVIICGYADADWAGDVTDRKSTTGYVFQVFGCVVSWASRKQAAVALSSTEAEYIAASAATCEAMWLKILVQDFGIKLNKPMTIFEDNMGCISLTKNAESKRAKHIDIRYHFIREKVNKEEVVFMYINTKEQLADIFTKGLSKCVFRRMVQDLNLCNSES